MQIFHPRFALKREPVSEMADDSNIHVQVHMIGIEKSA